MSRPQRNSRLDGKLSQVDRPADMEHQSLRLVSLRLKCRALSVAETPSRALSHQLGSTRRGVWKAR